MNVTAITRTSVGMILLMVLLVTIPAGQPTAHAAGPWYVAPSGDDGNSCLSSAAPCATINAAIDKADPNDAIYIAEGIYTDSGTAVVLVDKNVDLSGGWDLDFIAQESLSVIDAQYARRGMIISNNVSTSLERVEVSHGVGQSSGGGGGILVGSNATVSLTDSIVQESQSYGGISASYANLTLVRSTIRHSIDQGIFNYLGTLRIVSSVIVGNTYGIVSNGDLFIENSTVSGNTHGGIAMDCSGTIEISSSTITENNDFGLRTYGCNDAIMRNTILAGNAGTTNPNCSGPVQSDGYNLIGDMTGCGFVSSTGDLTDIDPELRSLRDNGGPTQTHALLYGSPAIDAGNPDGCTNDLGDPLTSDQRGFPRYGRCDIGAYEWQPALIGPNAVFLPSAFRSSCATRLFFDDFSAPRNGWPIYEDQYVLFGYLNNEYRILLKGSEMWAGARPSFRASNYVAAVDVRNATGVAGSYGMIFGISNDWTQFYIFEIDRDGLYSIFRVDSNSWRLLAMGFSSSIHTGTATNQLKIERNGNQIRAYANGQLLKILDDGNYVGLRYIGLFNTTSLTQSNVDARFDNFTVYPIACGSSLALQHESGLPVVDDWESDLQKNWEIRHFPGVTP